MLMVFRTRARFWLGVLLLGVLGCRCTSEEFQEMESAEYSFNMRVRQQSVAFMSLETMFPDLRLRALAKAAGDGNIRKIDALISEGVPVNGRGSRNATPLFWATRSLHGFVRLLEHGADPNAVADDGSTVMHWIARGEDSSFLREALAYGGNPNLPAGSDSRTPLFEAINSNHECFELLIDAGADLNAVDRYGSTAAMSAALHRRYEIVYELLQRGADYRVRNNVGETLTSRVNETRGKLIPNSEWEQGRLRVADWLASHGEPIVR